MAQESDPMPDSNILPRGLLSDFQMLQDNLKLILENGIGDFFSNSGFSYLDGAYAKFTNEHRLSGEERLLILLSLAQYLDPEFLTHLVTQGNKYQLIQCPKTGLLLPTGATFLKLLAGNDISARIEAYKYFGTDHLFYRKSVIDFGEVGEGVPKFFGVLKLSPAYHELFLFNRHSSPRFSQEFPAHLLETHLDWCDLIINPSAADKVDEIRAFLDHGDTLREGWGLKKHMKRGYRCLFYGPSGTGKTLAATLLGKHIGREVYRVDISSVISKYIGETSKNLNSLFNTAEDKNWILFFDEGDALFGKRVDTSQADDKNVHFANQDIAYLLQRIENYNGLVVVASNFKKNMDDAFSRRFQSVVFFDILNPELSKEYWQSNIPANVSLGPGINLDSIVKQYRLSPASIINIINRVCLKTIRKGSTQISNSDLELCIKDEEYK